MKHILLIANLFPPHIVGGAEKVAAQLAVLLARTDKVSVITLSSDSSDSNDSYEGVNVYRVALENTYYPFSESPRSALGKAIWHFNDVFNHKMANKVEGIIRRIQPDIINTHNLAGFSVAVWNVARELGVPVVHTMHDYYLLCPKSTMFDGARNCESQCFTCGLYSHKKKNASQQVGTVVSVSNFVMNRHRSNGYFSNAKAHVIKNGQDHSASAQRAVDDLGKLRFGFIGRLSQTKGVEAILELFAERFPDTTLVIAGTGDPIYEKYLHKRFSGKNVFFLGFVSADIFFSQIDINIVPSLWNDPLPSVVFESFYRSVPVIGAHRGGIPEMIQDGVNGYLYEPAAVDGLHAAIQVLIDEPFRYRALSAGAYASGKEYSATNFVAQYRNIFDELC